MVRTRDRRLRPILGNRRIGLPVGRHAGLRRPRDYDYKQLLFEPFLGGGIITAVALPLIDRVGATWALIGATALTVLMILLGIRIRRTRTPQLAP